MPYLSLPTPFRDGLLLFLLHILSALLIQKLFGNNDIIRFPWLVYGPVIYFTIIHGYTMIGITMLAVFFGNLLIGVPIDFAVQNTLRNLVIVTAGF
ncbi:hypothetical protein [Candidatus Magnetaquicoccus inordinatus]|uniref:hypothetical protein n=1 Tax=Candidatus Magnetaquicoccus inordinatus TaxID=2496818 RepID=UPI00102BF16D|nr:hypothetical protein [Candidatus Magnetaquicoccus inordinatus]